MADRPAEAASCAAGDSGTPQDDCIPNAVQSSSGGAVDLVGANSASPIHLPLPFFWTFRQVGAQAGAAAKDMGAALDSLSNASAGMTAILATISVMPSATAQASALKELAPVQDAPAFQAAQAVSVVNLAVDRRQQAAMAYDPATGRAAAAEDSRNGLWAQTLGGGGVRDASNGNDGYRMREFGLAAGADRRFTEQVMGGTAFSWLRDLSHGGEGADTASTLDSYQLALYGTYRPNRLFFDGQAAVGYNNFHQKRDIGFLDETASADFDGEQYLLRGQAGYDLPITSSISLTPLAGLTWTRSVSDGYTESGAGAADLTVDRRGVNSLSHDLGAKVGWSMDTGFGTLRPEARAAWVHDYNHAGVGISGSIDGAAFATTASRISPNGAQLGLAATLNSTDDLSLRAEYTGDLRPIYQSHTGMVTASWGF